MRTGSRRCSAPGNLHPAPPSPSPCSKPPRTFNLLKHRILHLLESGRGARSSPDLRISELDKDECLTKMDRRTPSPEEKHTDTTTDSSTTSRKPPAEAPPNPTLSTRLDPWFPHPPAAGAAVGGGGNHGPPAREVGRRGVLTKSLPSTVDGRGERPRSVSSYLYHLLQ